MHLITKPPKVCIIRVPITLCQLQIVQIYEEASVPTEDFVGILLKLIKCRDNYRRELYKLHQNVVGMLQLQGIQPDCAKEACDELEWFTTQIQTDLRNLGLIRSGRFPFNSVQSHGPDGLMFSRICREEEVS